MTEQPVCPVGFLFVEFPLNNGVSNKLKKIKARRFLNSRQKKSQVLEWTCKWHINIVGWTIIYLCRVLRIWGTLGKGSFFATSAGEKQYKDHSIWFHRPRVSRAECCWPPRYVRLRRNSTSSSPQDNFRASRDNNPPPPSWDLGCHSSNRSMLTLESSCWANQQQAVLILRAS